jgi:GH24 family phage-related lysozyme (muramidase)
VTEAQLNRVKARTEQREGRIAWLYRDSATEGNATCGVGHLVADLAHAQSLPFRPSITAAEWHGLMTAPRGMRAAAYQSDTEGRLTDAAMDALLDQDLNACLERLRVQFSDFDGYPGGVQEALLDMAFNLGIGGLLKFSHLVCAVRASDWKSCSLQCHRRGISEERNQETAALFLAA